MKRQYRIYVNGSFQFAFSVDGDVPTEQIAARAAETMKINVRSVDVSPGVLNLLTH